MWGHTATCCASNAQNAPARAEVSAGCFEKYGRKGNLTKWGHEPPGGRPYRRERATGHWTLAPAIQELQAAGCESLRAIAAGLEERGIPAPRGGSWSAVQVARVLEAAAIPFDASVGAAEDTSNMLRLVQGLRNRSDIQLTTQLLGKRI